MPNFIDLTGQRFGRLTVLDISHRLNRRIIWRCICDCGKETRTATIADLRSGNTRSCGCLSREISSRVNLKHGHTSGGKWSPTFRSWADMRTRCFNPNIKKFKNHGGRGITICDRWDDFQNFLSDMGERPSGLTLDRIDNDGNYEPGNCRWATWSQQNKNRRKFKRSHTTQSP